MIELKLPREGVLVLGIRRAAGAFLGAPTAEMEVHAGDTLILYGPVDRIEDLEPLQRQLDGLRAEIRKTPPEALAYRCGGTYTGESIHLVDARHVVLGIEGDGYDPERQRRLRLTPLRPGTELRAGGRWSPAGRPLAVRPVQRTEP